MDYKDLQDGYEAISRDFPLPEYVTTRRKCGKVCSRFALSVQSLRRPPEKILISPV